MLMVFIQEQLNEIFYLHFLRQSNPPGSMMTNGRGGLILQSYSNCTFLYLIGLIFAQGYNTLSSEQSTITIARVNKISPEAISFNQMIFDI